MMSGANDTWRFKPKWLGSAEPAPELIAPEQQQGETTPRWPSASPTGPVQSSANVPALIPGRLSPLVAITGGCRGGGEAVLKAGCQQVV